MAQVVFDGDGIATLFRQFDEKSYSIALEADKEPHISLHLHKDRLHVESNADDTQSIVQPFSRVQSIAGAERDCLDEVLRALDPKGLLFLRNIRSYDVIIWDDSGKQQWRRDAKIISRVDLVILETVNYVSDVSSLTRPSRFLVVGGEEKEAGKERVMAAFPVDQLGNPLIEDQDVFCFMSKRPRKYNFLLHFDNWETLDSTQLELVAHSILLCLHAISTLPSLKFTWMRYIPHRLWPEKLASLIRTCLSSDPLLVDQAGRYRSISQLCTYSKDQLDSHGNPLFPDSDDTSGPLSSQYQSQDQEILLDYGLHIVSADDMIARVRSLMKSRDWQKFLGNQDKDRRSRIRAWASGAFGDGHSIDLKTLGLLSLVPGGLNRAVASWKRQGGSIYMPDTDGPVVPDDLPLAVLDTDLSCDPDNRALYASLGAVTAEWEFVQKIILLKHNAWKIGDSTDSDINASNNHLRFLFWGYQKGHISSPEDFHLVMFDQRGNPKVPKRDALYFSALSGWSEEGGLSSLSGKAGYKAIAATTSFIHDIYTKSPPPLINNPATTATWKNFLLQVVGVSYKLRIFDRQHKEPLLSEEFLFITKHKPEWALNRLYEAYHTDTAKWTKNTKATQLVKEIKITCQDGISLPLSTTVLPLPSVLAACACSSLFGSKTCKSLPLLRVRKPLLKSDEHPSSRWKLFAAHFGIDHPGNPSLTCLVAILKAFIIREHSYLVVKGALTDWVVKIYLLIWKQRTSNLESIRSWFDKNPGVLYTPQLEAEGRQVPPVWGTRQGSEGYPAAVVTQAWNPVLYRLGQDDRESLKGFFRDGLGLWVDICLRASGGLLPVRCIAIPVPVRVYPKKGIRVSLPPPGAYEDVAKRLGGRSVGVEKAKDDKVEPVKVLLSAREKPIQDKKAGPVNVLLSVREKPLVVELCSKVEELDVFVFKGV